MRFRYLLILLAALTLAGCRRPQPPKVQVEEPAELTATAAADDVRVEPGLSAKVKVNLTGKNLKQAVNVELSNLPAGLSATPVSVGAADTSAEIVVTAEPGLSPGEHTGVVAFASAGAVQTKSAAFTITILKSSLTCVFEPSPLVIPKGKTRDVKITVQRSKEAYQGPVSLTVLNAKYVTATTKQAGPPDGDHWGVFAVQVAADAPEGKTQTLVHIGGGHQIQGVALLPIQVVGEPFALKVEPTQAAGVFGQTTRVKVTATRKDYQGPIPILLDGLPSAVKAKPFTLPAKETSGELELSVPNDAASVETPIQVRGSTDDGRGAAATFTLNIEGRPFALRTQPARVDIVQGSSGKLKVFVERAKEFKGAINLELRNLPKGCTAAPAFLAPGEKEATIEITAAEDVAAKPITGLSIVGSAKVGVEPREVKVDKVSLLVLEPFTLQVQPAKIELVEGQKIAVKVLAQRRAPFQGAINVELKNLPAGIIASEALITRDKDSAEIELTAGPGSGGRLKTDVQAIGSPANKRQVASGSVTVAVISKLFELKVDKSAKVTMGSKSMLRVAAQRLDYQGSIALELRNLPADLKAQKAEIPAGQNEIDIEITAADQVKDAKATVHVLGTATAAGKQQRVSGDILLEIIPGLFDLKVEPAILQLHHGGTAKAIVTVQRKGYDGPIAVELKNLPPKMTAKKATIPQGASRIEIDVEAMLSVLDGAKVDVFARASTASKTVDSGRFTVNVASVGQPVALELKIEPVLLKIAAGSTAKVKVVAMRKGYKGPIAVDLRNLPVDVESSKGTIAEGENVVEITLTARAKAEPMTKLDVCAVGIAVAADNRPYASPQVSLQVNRKP